MAWYMKSEEISKTDPKNLIYPPFYTNKKISNPPENTVHLSEQKTPTFPTSQHNEYNTLMGM